VLVANISQNDNVLIGDFAPNPGLEILFSHDKLTLLDAFGNIVEESDCLPEPGPQPTGAGRWTARTS